MTTDISHTNHDHGKGFQRIKLLLEEALFTALPPHAANKPFEVVPYSRWMGQCHSPGVKATKAGETEHQTDKARVCLDCYKIFIPVANYDASLETIGECAQFVANIVDQRYIQPNS